MGIEEENSLVKESDIHGGCRARIGASAGGKKVDSQ